MTRNVPSVVRQSGASQFLAVLAVCLLPIAALAEPQPGDAYREYTWVRQKGTEIVPLLVFSPTAERPDEEKRRPRKGTMVLDLTDVAKAEVVVEHWSGHHGTSKKSIRFNDHDWIELPLPVGTPGRAECYMAMPTQPPVEVPLLDLEDGVNEFALTCGPQIGSNFGYPAFAVYGITVRVFLKPRAPRPEGEIVSPKSGESIGDNPLIEVRAASPNGTVRRVDVIAEYEGFDWEGNGIYREWHYDLDYTKIRRHVGSADESPYRVTWDTRWIADQAKPVRFQARITDNHGVTYVTPAIGRLTFSRDRSVRLYKASDVPEGFTSRLGKPKHCTINVPDDLGGATAAWMVVGTHGPHEEPGQFGLNGHVVGMVAPGLPARCPKRYQAAPVPVDVIKQGANQYHAISHTKGHSLETLWPGPVLLIEFAPQ